MRCRFVVDVDVNPQSSPQMQRFVKLRQIKHGARTIDVPYWPAGTEYEHPKAAFFVLQGMAEPADLECAVAASMTEAERAKVQHAYQRQARGIIPKDWPLFDAGYIAGYENDGSYTPGPKWY
jgi:hypothetical protein